MSSQKKAIPTIHFNPATSRQYEENVYEVGGVFDDGLYEDVQPNSGNYEVVIPTAYSAKGTSKKKAKKISRRTVIFVIILTLLAIGVVCSIIFSALTLNRIQEANRDISRLENDVQVNNYDDEEFRKKVESDILELNKSNVELDQDFRGFVKDTEGDFDIVEDVVFEMNVSINHIETEVAEIHSELKLQNEAISEIEENLQNLTEGFDDFQKQLNNITGVRLVGSTDPHRGRVEILHDASWGTICDDVWRLSEATVICRMLGFGSAINAWPRAFYGEGTDPIWLDDVICTGNEVNIAYCRHNGWGVHDCGHHEDASVDCT